MIRRTILIGTTNIHLPLLCQGCPVNGMIVNVVLDVCCEENLNIVFHVVQRRAEEEKP